jgi:hypothetical protein
MATLAEMQAMRDALVRARFAGTLRVRSGDEEVVYRSDAEMKAALADLDASIAAASGAPRTRLVYVTSSKGT